MVSPGEYDFSDTPLEAMEYEVRWIILPGTAEADTGFVYMKVEEFVSEREPHLRVEWRPAFANFGNMDLVLLDLATYGVRYRLEPREEGAYGIFWYEEERAYSANVDPEGGNTRGEMALERPVFSVPTLPWVLSQLVRRVEEERVRIELPGFSSEGEGDLSEAVVVPGASLDYQPPEGGTIQPAREMTLHFESGSTWRYLVSAYPPYFLGITARNEEGTVTSLIEVVDWAPPALDTSRRIPEILRQSYVGG